jgi:hypothetical protein
VAAAIKSVEDLRVVNESWMKEREELDLNKRKDASNLEELARLEQIIDAIVSIATYIH